MANSGASKPDGTRNHFCDTMTVLLPEFVRRIAESGLITAAEVQAFIDRLPEDAKPLNTKQLAEALVRKKKLTPYQAQAIYSGKGSQLTLGNYVILGGLGKGGMGVVFKALHRRMHRVVAIKVLSRSSLKEPSLAWRFKREVRAAAMLEHPNIVTAYDADEAGGRQFLVMQYVDGSDLSSLVKEQGTLPVSMATSCIRQAARGLEYAHGRGVVHRDVKPANLFLGRDGTLKILDMGLARLDCLQSESKSTEVTNTGVVMGSVDYMAPEQAADMRNSDARADIYSLGYTLWYLLTGKEAYQGEGPIQRLVAHWERPLPSLQEACPEVSPVLEAVFHKMVAKRPEDRYQTMTEVITDLERARTSEAAAASHVLAGKEKKEDEELTEFLRVLADQPAERGTAAVRPGGLQRTKPTRDNANEQTDRAAPNSATPQKTGRHFLRKHALRLGSSAIVALLVVAFFAFTANQDGPDGQQDPKVPPDPESVAPKPGPDSIALLDKQLSHWNSNESWSVVKENGIWVLTGKGPEENWLSSKECYSCYTLWLEYRLSKDADSGIFVRADLKGHRFTFVQIQIVYDDNPRNQVRRKESTGALLGIRPPDVLSPSHQHNPLGWHKMVVHVQGSRVRIWIDDLLVNDNHGELPSLTVMPSSGCLGLESCPQGIRFRDIRIEKSNSSVATQTDSPTWLMRTATK